MTTKETKVEKTFAEKIGEIPDRVVYALLLIAFIIPMTVPMSLPVAVTPETIDMYNFLETIKPGEHVRFCIGLDPKAMMDTGWSTVAMIRQMWSKVGPNGERVKFTFVSWTGLAERLNDWLIFAFGRDFQKTFRYGIDYVNLGNVLPSTEFGFATFARDAWCGTVYDMYGTRLDTIPLTKETKGWNIANFKANIGVPGTSSHGLGQITGYFLPYFPDFKTNVIWVTGPITYYFWVSYIGKGYVKGITNGLFTGAEYEQLLLQKGYTLLETYATKSISPYSTTNVLAMALLILGNISYFLTRKKVK